MRKYDDEFKREAVRKIHDGQSVASVARELGCAESLLHRWKRDAVEASSDSEKELIALRKRLRDRERANPELPHLDDEYLRELNEAYNHFFFHYSATPLLVVETSQIDLSWGEEAVADLERQLRSMGKGTRYYVPRA